MTIERSAAREEAGRSCPYCHFPLKEGVGVIECGNCSSVHHADCWVDNGGCAVMGCNAAPLTGEREDGSLSVSKVAPPHPAADAPVYAGTEAASSRVLLYLAMAIGILAIAIVSGALVITLSRGESGVTGGTTAFTTSDRNEGAGSRSGSSNEARDASRSALPDRSRAAMKADIRAVLLEFHEDVVNGDYRKAWALMSKRKRRQSEETGGYSDWKSNQSTLVPYLDPSGIRIKVVDLVESSGVATVSVRGMTWSQPGASCSEWSGITWLKYESGSWHYDPGYSTTPERERKWKSRFAELLGGSC